jgi:hypothetical protein
MLLTPQILSPSLTFLLSDLLDIPTWLSHWNFKFTRLKTESFLFSYWTWFFPRTSHSSKMGNGLLFRSHSKWLNLYRLTPPAPVPSDQSIFQFCKFYIWNLSSSFFFLPLFPVVYSISTREQAMGPPHPEHSDSFITGVMIAMLWKNIMCFLLFLIISIFRKG